MGRPKKIVVDGAEPEAEGDYAVRFVKMWSSDKGLFLPGVKATLPALTAEALEAEGVVEVE